MLPLHPLALLGLAALPALVAINRAYANAVRCNERKKAGTPQPSTAIGISSESRPAKSASVAPITIVINQSPWFESFRKTVELYEKQTGNKVELDVNPFAGSLEKQRNSVRASCGQSPSSGAELPA